MLLRKSVQPSSGLNLNTTASLIAPAIIFLLFCVNGFLLYSAYQKIEKIFPAKDKKNVVGSDLMVKAEVINGCGISGLGDVLTDSLRKNSVDVIQSANYYQFDVDKTIIIDRTGNYKKAKKVADILVVPDAQIIQLKNPSLFLDVTVLTGKDYSKEKPLKEKI